MLAKAVNYAALTHGESGPLYALKGIFGAYDGYYSFMPYQKIQEYTEIDQRDVWEYELNLDRAERRRLLLHIWELQGIATDYWFFDENCAFNLSTSSRPRARCSWRSRAALVIPADTLKAIEAAGLLAGHSCRPSRAARVRHGARLLGDTGNALILDLSRSARGAGYRAASHARARTCLDPGSGRRIPALPAQQARDHPGCPAASAAAADGA